MNVVGVDLGGTKILTRLVDPETGRARGWAKLATPTGGPQAIVDAVVASVERLPGQESAPLIGVGLPGPVASDGVVGPCANLVGWTEPIPVAQMLAARLGRPVVVANDVNCGAVAEFHVGGGRDVNDLLAVFVGTGVGGGLVLDGALRSGRQGTTGEIGHLSVRPGGRRCGCGGRGHLEAYAGRAGIEREARRRAANGASSLLIELANGGKIKSRHLRRGLEEGDELTRELVADAASALAIGIGNTAALLDIERVVLGGGVLAKLGQRFVDEVVASPDFGGFGAESCDLRLAQRIGDAGAVGAAIIAAAG